MSNSHFSVAIHIVTALAVSGSARVTSEDLAGSINTSDTFVRRVVGGLAKAGIVSNQRGATGGTRLASDPATTTLAMIYRAVNDHPLLLPATPVPNPSCPVGSVITSVIAGLFDEAEAALVSQLATTTIEDLVQRVHDAHRARVPT
jgi:Rrf2 family protein